jgi:hypothetical protein
LYPPFFSAIAMARPMPRIPPVTTATLAMLSSLTKLFRHRVFHHRDSEAVRFQRRGYLVASLPHCLTGELNN